MSVYEQRDLSGALFKNNRKENDSQPNMTGYALIDGVRYRVSAWTKDGAKGRWQSLSFQREDARPSRHDDHTQRTVREQFYEDEPF